MFNKNWFSRTGSKVIIDINSGLQVPKFIYPFMFQCDDENYAELLKDKLNVELEAAKKIIAKDAVLFLEPSEISTLKKQLNNWDSKNHRWK